MMQPESHFDDSSIKNLIERMKGACIVEPESISETKKDSPMTSTSSGGTNSFYGLSSRKVEHTFHTNATQSSSALENSSFYQFTGSKMGYAIFIINSEFQSEKERQYAVKDRDNMITLFQQLGFEIKLLENKSKKELLQNLADIRNEIGIEHDCMACIISSHGFEKNTESNGRQHEICTKDSTVLTKDILNNFADDKCENLKGKPKMFFIQACRCLKDSPETSHYDYGFDIPSKHAKISCHYDEKSSMDQESVFQIPCSEDFLVMFTCSPGKSGMTDQRGGWLIHCLSCVFKTLLDSNYKEHFLQILTKVCGKMAQDLKVNCSSERLFHETKSAAVIYHMLTKDLYLKPKKFGCVMRQTSKKPTYV
ncbi:caspase-3-like [Mytilus edulis]|uniref:caspase-3-like n=1 Tax=Mytilus edulis TaxID=6550 RepID=UPI0039EF6A26